MRLSIIIAWNYSNFIAIFLTISLLKNDLKNSRKMFWYLFIHIQKWNEARKYKRLRYYSGIQFVAQLSGNKEPAVKGKSNMGPLNTLLTHNRMLLNAKGQNFVPKPVKKLLIKSFFPPVKTLNSSKSQLTIFFFFCE